LKQNNTRGTRNARPGEVRQVLAELGLTVKSFQGKNLRVSPSPCCDHVSVTNSPCFSINEDTGLWRCFNGACLKKAGNWVRFCDTVRIPLSETERYLESNVAYFKDEWVQLMKLREGDPISPAKHAQLLEYCSSRRITKDTLDEFRVSTHDGRSIMVPIFTAQDNEWVRVAGRVIGCVGERKGTNFYAYSGGPTHLLMGNNLLDLTAKQKRIYLFEGQWDMFTAYELGLRNVFSLPNGASNIKAKEMLQFVPEDWEIYVCTDMDEAGNAAARSIFCQIPAEKYRRIKIPAPHKDLNDWFVADPQLTKEDVLRVAVGIDIDQRREEREKRRLNWINHVPEAADIVAFTPWRNINKELRGGLKAGSTSAFDSTFDFCEPFISIHTALHNASLQIKTGLIPLLYSEEFLVTELNVKKNFLNLNDDLVSKYLTVCPLEYQSTTPVSLLDEVQSLLDEGCKLIIIDNIEALIATTLQKEECFKKITNLINRSSSHCIFLTSDEFYEERKQIYSKEKDRPYYIDLIHLNHNMIYFSRSEDNVREFTQREVRIAMCKGGILNLYAKILIDTAKAKFVFTEYAVKTTHYSDYEYLDFEGKRMITPKTKKKTKAI